MLSIRSIDFSSKEPGLCKQQQRTVVNRAKLFKLTLERGAGISAKSDLRLNNLEQSRLSLSSQEGHLLKNRGQKGQENAAIPRSRSNHALAFAYFSS